MAHGSEAHEVSSYRVLHGDDEHVLIRQHVWQPTRQVASLLAQVVSSFYHEKRMVLRESHETLHVIRPYEHND